MINIKKIILIIVFLLPISIISFVVKNKTIFFDEISSKTIIVHLSDKNLSLDLEDYIIGVVAGEMPALFEKEALKAQAIASRSYALSKISNNEITITSTTSDQVFLTKQELQKKWLQDYEIYYNKIKESVLETANQVLKRDNVILRTYYFAMSNGYTEDSQTVFNEETFKSTESKWDNESLNNFVVEKEYPNSQIKLALKLNDENIVIENIVRNATNHVEKLQVNNIEFTGITFRNKLGLRSTDFTITKTDHGYLIITKGYGHGVGMSQYGANGMAKEGYNYIEILKHYYNNVEIKNI